MGKWKYAEYIYSTKKTDKGYVWTIWGIDHKPMQTSLDSEDVDEMYFETQRQARAAAIEAIQDHYN